jgi:hypothetical protein
MEDSGLGNGYAVAVIGATSDLDARHRAGYSAHGRRSAPGPEGLRRSLHQPGCTSEKSIRLVDAVP